MNSIPVPVHRPLGMLVAVSVCLATQVAHAQAPEPKFAFGLGLGYALGQRRQVEVGTTGTMRLKGRISALAIVEGTHSRKRLTLGARVLAAPVPVPVYFLGGWFIWRNRTAGSPEDADGPMIGIGMESRRFRSDGSGGGLTFYAEGRLLGKGTVRSTVFAGVRLRLRH